VSRRPVAYPVTLTAGAILSVQAGAAIAFNLFDELGPMGTVFLRVGFAAAVLVGLWRPQVRGHGQEALRMAALFGFVLAGMNLSFYEGLERVPLGIAVTLEFVGPLGVAIFGSRRPRDLLWVALAAGGILLLSPGLGDSLDRLGAGLCLLAGCFWAAYIVLSERVGRAFAGGRGLALALAFGTILLIPGGIAEGGGELLRIDLLAAAFALAMLSSAIPYSLELEALRHLPKGVFGVLMSLEPGAAALVGFVALDQSLSASELLAIGMVVVASAGALRSAAQLPPESAPSGAGSPTVSRTRGTR
jgi:inner membrane transporter RhtA